MKVRILITLDPDVLAGMKSVAKAQGATVSGMINKLMAEQVLGDHSRSMQMKETGKIEDVKE